MRIAILLGCEAEAEARTPGSGVADEVLASIRSWPTDPRFDPLDRACLGFAEHFVIDVASIDDDTVAAVRDHLGDEGLANFVNALLVVEQRIRLRLVWDRLFGGRLTWNDLLESLPGTSADRNLRRALGGFAAATVRLPASTR